MEPLKFYIWSALVLSCECWKSNIPKTPEKIGSYGSYIARKKIEANIGDRSEGETYQYQGVRLHVVVQSTHLKTIKKTKTKLEFLDNASKIGGFLRTFTLRKKIERRRSWVDRGRHNNMVDYQN